MTRHILLMRHAKSDWSDGTVRDHDRPLNERGARAAPRMGRLLRDRDLVPARVLCSTAVRAVETARLALDAMGAAPPVDFHAELYHASPEIIAAAIDGATAPAGPLLVIGHNPGLEELVEQAVGLPVPMPTAAVALLEARGPVLAALLERGRGIVLRGHWRPKALDVEGA